MKKRILKKSLVIAIMLLFIGMGVVPAGNIVENDSRSLKSVDNSEEPEDFMGIGKTCYGYQVHPNPDLLVWFDIDYPGFLHMIGIPISSDKIAGGTWVDGVWWCCEYVPISNSNIWIIDHVTGEMTLVGTSGSSEGLHGLAYDDTTRTMYACGSTNLFTIDMETGAATLVGSFGISGSVMIGIASDGYGNIYGEDLHTDSLYSIDHATGTATLVGPLGLDLNYGQDMAIDKENGICYLSAFTVHAGNEGALYTCNLTTGTTTKIGNLGSEPTQITGFAIPYENEGGKTLYVGGDGSGNYTRIQEAIDDANHGDTVFVFNGMYVEDLIVDKSINLFGEDRNTTVIHGVWGTTVVEIIADGVNVTGFTIEGEGNNVGILIRRYSNSTISNNNISNCTFGIDLWGSKNIIVSENFFDSCDVSITSDGSRIIISGNTLNSSKTFDFLGDITFWGGSNNIIVNNTLTNFKGKCRIGIYLEGLHYSVIKGNTFNGYNAMAIHLYGLNFNNVISGNAFLNNGLGIFVGTSMFNTICCNNFIGNNRNARYGFFSPFNTWDGNYWDKPRVLPYPIFGLLIPLVKFDWHPAKEPYDIGV